MLSYKRFGRMQTSGTNRNSRQIFKGFVADSAFVREDEVKQRRGNGPYCARIDDRSNSSEPSTREDAPPPKQEHSSTNLIRLLNCAFVVPAFSAWAEKEDTAEYPASL